MNATGRMTAQFLFWRRALSLTQTYWLVAGVGLGYIGFVVWLGVRGIVLSVGGAIAGVAFLLTPARRSRYGDRVFTWLRNRTPSDYSTPHENSNTQLLLAFALFGATALSGSALTDLQTAFTMPSGSDGGDGDGDGGGGGCGG